MEKSQQFNSQFVIDIKQSPIIFDYISNGIMITDDKSKIIYVNPAYSKITGYTEKDVIGENPGMLHSGYHDEDFYQAMWEAIVKNGAWEGEVWNRRKSGAIYPEFLTITKINLNESGDQFYIGIFSDISFMKKDAEKKLHLAYYDPLTELANRTLFSNRAEFCLDQAKQNHSSFAIFFMDLDKFKMINDTHGHVVGDQLLRIIGSRLKAIIRSGDTIARVGGDEFAAVLQNLNEPSAAITFAERVVAEIEKPFELNAVECHVSISIGISFYPTNGLNVDELIIKADKAMYEAKRTKNKIVCAAR